MNTIVKLKRNITHVDEHHRDDETTIYDTRFHEFPFPHHRLDAYHVSLQLAKATKQLTCRIPRGYRSLADQLKRAAAAVVLNLSEGANKISTGEKRQSFSRARGECGEVAAAAELSTVLELVPKSYSVEVMALACRVGAMLTGLIKRMQ
jgi:four helix bundle protein